MQLSIAIKLSFTVFSSSILVLYLAGFHFINVPYFQPPHF